MKPTSAKFIIEELGAIEPGWSVEIGRPNGKQWISGEGLKDARTDPFHDVLQMLVHRALVESIDLGGLGGRTDLFRDHLDPPERASGKEDTCSLVRERVRHCAADRPAGSVDDRNLVPEQHFVFLPFRG